MVVVMVVVVVSLVVMVVVVVVMGVEHVARSRSNQYPERSMSTPNQGHRRHRRRRTPPSSSTCRCRQRWNNMR